MSCPQSQRTQCSAKRRQHPAVESRKPNGLIPGSFGDGWGRMDSAQSRIPPDQTASSDPDAGRHRRTARGRVRPIEYRRRAVPAYEPVSPATPSTSGASDCLPSPSASDQPRWPRRSRLPTTPDRQVRAVPGIRPPPRRPSRRPRDADRIGRHRPMCPPHSDCED